MVRLEGLGKVQTFNTTANYSEHSINDKLGTCMKIKHYYLNKISNSLKNQKHSRKEEIKTKKQFTVLELNIL
jgi:hypothetical protein